MVFHVMASGMGWIFELFGELRVSIYAMLQQYIVMLVPIEILHWLRSGAIYENI